MQQMSLQTLIAVFGEIFGQTLFWAMVAGAGLVILLYIWVLIRDRAVNWRKFLRAQLSMPFGAVAAVWFVLDETHSGLSDIGGPIDVIIMLAIAAAGAIGLAIFVYTFESLIHRRPQSG